MPQVFRNLPPLSPRFNPSTSSRTHLQNATSIKDPAPEHMKVHSPENDLAENKDFDNATTPEEKAKSLFEELQNNENAVNSKTCSTFFWRGKKVSSTDVASVGNASDTDIMWNQPTTGRALHENAKVALNRQDYSTALELFQAILDAQTQRFGSAHPSVAAAMHNVGVCRQRMGQDSLAEKLLAEAVRLREKTLGKEHVEVAASLSKLGSVRIAMGKFEEAFSDLRKALNIARQQQSATPNKTVAQMLCHLGCLYFEKGEMFAAQATFEDAVDIYRKLWSQHEGKRDDLMLQLTDTLCNIGSIFNRRKLFSQAISSFQEALDLQRGILEHDHPRIISTLDNLAYAYSKNKEYARAVTCYRTMLRAQVSQSGTFTEECLGTFRKRIIMYEKLKLTAEAVKDTKEVLKLQKTMLPRDDYIIAETRSLLEDLNKKRGKKTSLQPVSTPPLS